MYVHLSLVCQRKTATITKIFFHCIRTAQSSRVGSNLRVHRIVYLVVKRGNILVNVVVLKIIYFRLLLSLINPAVYLLNKVYVS